MTPGLLIFIVILAVVLDAALILWWRWRKGSNPVKGLWGKLNHRAAYIISVLGILGFLALIELVNRFIIFDFFPTIFVLVSVGMLLWQFFKKQPLNLWASIEVTIEEQGVMDEPPDALPQETSSARGWREEMRAWIWTHRLEVILLIVGGVLAFYIWRFSPSVIADRFTLAGEDGHPFKGFLYFRVLLDEIAPQLAGWVGGLGSLLSLGMLIPARNNSRERAIHAGLLIAGLTLACLGQLAALDYYAGSALRLYGMAILIFILWSHGSNPLLESELFTWKLSRTREISLFVLILALTIFARFYAIDAFPYGIEADEGKWTAKVTAAMLDGEYRQDAVFHLYSVPVGFFMQAPFLHLLGPGLISGRISVAFYSVLGSVVFYWVARKLLNPQAALLSTTLLAVSLLDLGASRYSNVETLVKLWPLLTLLLLFWSFQSQKITAYLLAGISAALGWLTYDTVLPILVVCFLIFAIEYRHSETSWEQRIRRLSVFLLPALLTFPITAAYVNDRRFYYQIGSNLTSSLSLSDYFQGFFDLLESFFVHTAYDFFYNRPGPVLNSLLLPWLVLGLVIALTHFKQKKMAWILIFFTIFLIPAPTLTQSPWGRVYYPGFASVYLLIVIGLISAYDEILNVFGKVFQPLFQVITIAGLSVFIVFNLYIYFNETVDDENKEIRRELYEISLASASENGKIYFPFLTRENDLLALEDPLIWLGMRSAPIPVAMEKGAQMVALDSLLLTLQIEGPSYEQVTIVRDRTNDGITLEQEIHYLEIQSCYPGLNILVGRYFDRYQLDQTTLMKPFCTTP